MGDPYHRSRTLAPIDLVSPIEVGTPYRIGNYLKRVLKPMAAKAGIPDMTYRALRRTFTTEFQRHGSPKDAQAQLRHSKLEITGWYMREIPENVPPSRGGDGYGNLPTHRGEPRSAQR